MKLLLLVLGAGAAVLVVFLVLVTAVSRDTQTDCAEVRDPAPGAWQAGDFAARERIVTELSFCKRLVGRSQSEVEELLGSPTEVGPGEVRYRLAERNGSDSVPPRDAWSIFFDADGRVSDTRFDVYATR